jgi:hypothetical protein
MTAAPENFEGVRRGEQEGSLSPLPATSALERITVLLRHMDTELAAVRQEVSAVHRLSVREEVPDLDGVLGPIERVLAAAADTFGLEPAVLDGRRALRGTLNILWADLIDMSPENLHKYWGVEDIPDYWHELHCQLLSAVERAIAQL